MLNTDVDWQGWVRRWDSQQQAYMPRREERFDVMIDVVGAFAPTEPTVLDLGCGPGAIAARLLRRLPDARCLALDFDPALLALGRGALGTMDGRITWVEADLRDPSWPQRLPTDQVDAVVSTTALHWLDAGQLLAVYRRLGQLVRPGGVVLNGDHLRFGADQPALGRAVAAIVERREDRTQATGKTETWEAWWDALHAEPAMTALVEERRRRFGHGHHGAAAPGAALHAAALIDAGFREVGVVWQDLDDRVLTAVR